MSSAKQAKKKSRTSARSSAGEMPSGDMNSPFAEGLMDMPVGADTNDSGNVQGSYGSANSPMEGGLMPGESSESAGTTESGMPGGDMTST